ncbi:MAG: radical SAM protein, partial [Promethearchaeota archaeon]
MKLKNATALFEITNKCNLRCKHCYKENLDGNDLTLEQIQTILEKLSAFGISHLILTGGEPLLRKDLFQIIDFAIKNEIKNCAINTNGILLDDPKILNEIKDRLDIISSIP